jgi:hypothetical protein
MIIDAKQLLENTNIKCDVCIMGAGPAGITLALELAKNKKLDIVLIEGGGRTYDFEGQKLYEGTTSTQFYPSHFASRLRYLGGTTNHWEGSCRPLDHIDFEKRDWIPNSGWPISRPDLDPYYEKAHRYCQLNEFNYSIDHWEQQTNIKRLFNDPGKLKTVVNQHSPPTRFGTVYLNELKASKNIRVYLFANIVDIKESRPASSIEKVSFKVLGGVSGEVIADEYILAMGGLENSRMLLLYGPSRN